MKSILTLLPRVQETSPGSRVTPVWIPNRNIGVEDPGLGVTDNLFVDNLTHFKTPGLL